MKQASPVQIYQPFVRDAISWAWSLYCHMGDAVFKVQTGGRGTFFRPLFSSPVSGRVPFPNTVIVTQSEMGPFKP